MINNDLFCYNDALNNYMLSLILHWNIFDYKCNSSSVFTFVCIKLVNISRKIIRDK